MKNLLKFSIIGLFNMIFIDLIFLYLLKEYFNVDTMLAVFLAFVVANINSFFMHKKWTFGRNGSIYKFLFVVLIALLLNLILMEIFLEKFKFWYIHSKIITIFLVLFWNFFMNKYFVFKEKKHSASHVDVRDFS